MIIRINNVDYSEIKNLSFAPETDVIGKTVPINRFTVEIKSSTLIQPNDFAYLLDNNADTWAYYWITDSYFIETGWQKIIAQSTMILLDRCIMPAKMYDGTDTFADVIGEIFDSIQTAFPSMTVVDVDASFANTTIEGYAPEQNARDRLLWVCFCARAYVKSFFNQYVEILPVDRTETLIPAEKTFYKPKMEVGDYVTELRIVAYTYTLTQTDPARTDKYVKIGNDVYIQTEQEYALQNPSVPVTVADNVVKLNKNTLVNQNNVQGILNDLASYYFNRYTVSADVIDDAEFLPADKVIVSNNEYLTSGYIKSANFKFGHHSRASLKIQAANAIEADTLAVVYLCDTDELGRKEYLLPIGYAYSIQNPYLDLMPDAVRRIYRPVNEYATGTVVSGGVTDNEQYEIAVEAEEREVLLLIVSSATESDSVVTIV